ncbi:XRE family transcriptional regulator [Hyphomicrobiales bacterium]|nr:XRE family transcriptional regulator [Hyphomicrobiales bacterium]CAH1695471.1 XRE family transcriptional regulator [Hyphomicrobiales bacterium]
MGSTKPNRHTHPNVTQTGENLSEIGTTVGGRIRRTRVSLGISLKQLSDSAGVSIGTLSQIERGIANPSFKTMQKIQSALGVTQQTLFPTVPARAEDPDYIRRKDRRPLCDLGVLTKELISTGTSRSLDMMILHIPPGGSTGETPLVSLTEKSGLVLMGEVVLQYGDETCRLAEGDSFQFEGTRPHSIRNASSSDARVLWLVSNITFDRHL